MNSILVKVRKINIAFIMLVLCSCGDSSELARSEYPLKVLDSKILPEISRNMYWLDAENILFAVTGEFDKEKGEISNFPYIWNHNTDDLYKIADVSQPVCVRDKEIRYGRLMDVEDKKSGIILSRKLVLVAGQYQLGEEKVLGGFEIILDRNCNLASRPGTPEYEEYSYQLAEFGLTLKPIRNEDEIFRMNPRLGVFSGAELLKVLPVRAAAASISRYSKTMDAYLIRVGYQPDQTAVSQLRWPEGIQAPVYVLGRDLELKTDLLPKKWGDSQPVLFELSPSGIVAGGYIKDLPGGNTGDGIFLLLGQSIEPLIFGTIYKGALSDDGCKIAFIHLSRQSRSYITAMGNRKLVVLDICHKNGESK